ncbi:MULTISPECIES: DUF4406 domain-containing protein [unclassified Carboxylicivirga]|uniref:DUF4406 domain-containing protein n=1 Tax=Carboxylicivirga TaxID=1628153 RepID=UPI0011775A86|nr:DUF4406 domain-containing protein [Carboxylicivirga sp. M1479]TRX70728.1 DUF4406 domain-containing protein [Carboxylicivirga sp. M1479]
MVVYLSGINYETNKQELERLKANLFDLGCTIITPEAKELDKLIWSENVRLRLSFLQSSSTIYMLPNWKESAMARIELTAAMNEKMPLCFSPNDIRELITTLDR